MKKVLIKSVIACLVFVAVSFTASISVKAFDTDWTNNPNNCQPLSSTDLYNGQSCYPDNQVFCGLSGVNVQCADLSSVLTPPVGSITTTTVYDAATSPGYVVNCLATADAASPFCNNNGTYWCNADTTCLNTNHRVTQCNGGLWASEGGSYTCTNSCVSSYYDCDGGLNCERRNGSACVFLPGIDGTLVCTADAGGSCRNEISGGGSTYTCTCTPGKSFFETGTNTAYSTTDPLLWGTQYSTGDLINFGNSTTAEVFNVDNTGLLTTTNSTVNTMRIAFNDGVGTVGLYSINTNPDGTLAGNKGSLAMDYVNGKVYVNIDGSTDWNQLLDDSTPIGPTYTISTGLTDTSGTLTADISTGVLGGQTIYGGTGAGENLTIDSTTNATKGNILLNPNGGNVGIGTNNPADFALQVNGDIGPDAAPILTEAFDVKTLTNTYNTNYLNLIIGSDGFPMVTFQDTTTSPYTLKVAKCIDATCSGLPIVSIIDSGSGINTGYDISVAIGADGLPIIAYTNAPTNGVKVARCSNVACTAVTSITTLDNIFNNGFQPSIAIGSDGFPIISYIYGGSVSDLKVSKCSDVGCVNPPVITTIDSSDQVGESSTLIIPSDGLPLISYYDRTNQDIKFAKCINISCTGTSTLYTFNPNTILGLDIEMILGGDGYPIVVYQDYTNTDVMVAKCIDANCALSPTVSTIDTNGDLGREIGIALLPSGLPVISYNVSSVNDLRIAKCINISCTGTATISNLDPSYAVFGLSSTLVIGENGIPLVLFSSTLNRLFIVGLTTLTLGGSNLGSATKFFNSTYSANYFAKNSISISNFDLAEDYKVSDTSIVAGDVVSMSKSGGILVDKTSEAYSNNVLGVISTSPGLKLSDWNLSEEERQNMRPVALAGRVPVKVSTENGNIEIGDYLVPATKAGYAMKQCGTKYCNPGISIGRALESFTYKNGGDSNGVKVELQEVKEEVKIIEQEVQDANVTNEEKEAVRVAVEATEDIIKPMALEQYGEGRIMMFVDLGYRLTPELSSFLSGQYKSNTSGDDTTMMTNLNSNSILANDIQNIKFDNLTVVDLNVTGLLTANSISTSLISSIGQNAIEFKLGDREGISKFKITNSVGGYLFGINSKGIFEFGKDNPSRGQTTIPVGTTEIKVDAEGVNKDSIILLTLISNNDNSKSITLTDQGENFFVVRLNSASDEDLKFNWWYSN